MNKAATINPSAPSNNAKAAASSQAIRQILLTVFTTVERTLADPAWQAATSKRIMSSTILIVGAIL